MIDINRRLFLAGGAMAISTFNSSFGSDRLTGVDETLQTGVARRKIPAVVGMVGDGKKTLYAGAFGKRDATGPPVSVDGIFNIASMTKAITSVAAMQLVE